MHLRLVVVAAVSTVVVAAWSDRSIVVLAQNTTPTCTVPQTPEDLAIARTGPDIRLSWRDPSPSTCRATRFYIELSRGGTDIREFDTTQTDIVITEVGIGSHWRYAVRGFNTRGLSPQRSLYQLEPPAPCQAAPPPVSSVSARVSGDQVTIEWLATATCLSTGFLISAAASPDGPELYALEIPYPTARTWSGTAPRGTWFVRVHAGYVGRRFTEPSPWTVVVVQ
jgi:hypothetical protein